MSKSRKPQQPKTRSFIALDAKLNRAAGVHKDQKRRTDHRAVRRDKSYKLEA